MSQPTNVERCAGYIADGELREGCDDCQRRTPPDTFPAKWVEPPAIVVFECHLRIPPQ